MKKMDIYILTLGYEKIRNKLVYLFAKKHKKILYNII